MAVPTAVATSIRYKDTDYAFGTPIVFTELKPTIEITFDIADTTNMHWTSKGGTQWASDYEYVQKIGQLEVISSTVYKTRIEVSSLMDSLDIKPFNTDGQGTIKTWAISTSLATGAMDSWQYITGFILRDTLIAEFTSGELAVVTEGGVYKIAWEGAHEAWNQPYIITQIITGGDRNSSQLAYAEMLWRVVVHTPSLVTAGQMENAIHKALARGTATINLSAVTQAGEIEEVTPVTDRYQVQNVPLYVSGGIYRIRLAKG